MRALLASIILMIAAALGATTANAAPLASPASFSHIEAQAERSAAIFTEASKVFQHARCANCHPAGDRPLQTDASTRHRPMVARGEKGFGRAAMKCGNCHMTANREAAGVPGAPHWHLAQRTMAFEGRSPGEICRSISDPAMNGDRPVEAMVMHVAFDPLIAWAWLPGADRSPPPGTHQGFIALIDEWIDTGAACPTD